MTEQVNEQDSSNKPTEPLEQQITSNNVLDLIKNINFVGIITSLSDKLSLVKNLYNQNKKIVDSVLCVISLTLILLGRFDLSLVHKLYFCALTYMTVNALGSFYNKLPKNGTSSPTVDMKVSIEALEHKESCEILHEIVLIGNNWLTYVSLIMCDWLLNIIEYLIGGIIISFILHVGKFLLYMQYCKQFCKSLDKVETMQYRDTYIDEQLSKNVSLPVYVKHLINLMTINNVFCHSMFAVVNLKVLSLIDFCLTSSLDLLLAIFQTSFNTVSAVQPVSSGWMQSTKTYLYSMFARFMPNGTTAKTEKTQ